MNTERRSTPRYALPAAVEYEGSNIEGAGTIANISVSGALIEPAAPPVEPGNHLNLRASYLASGVELSSDVVRTTESGFAVQFAELQPDALAALRKLISLAELRMEPDLQDWFPTTDPA
jgi:hypothetical protein